MSILCLSAMTARLLVGLSMVVNSECSLGVGISSFPCFANCCYHVAIRRGKARHTHLIHDFLVPWFSDRFFWVFSGAASMTNSPVYAFHSPLA